MANKKKQRAWGRNSRIVVEGFIPGDRSQSATTSESGGERGSSRREKKRGSQMAREAEAYLGLVKLSERYVGLEVNGEGMVLSCGEDTWDYDVLVNGKIFVSGESFDLEKEEGRKGLVHLLGSGNGLRLKRVEEMESSEGKEGYDLFAEFINGSQNFHLNDGELLVHLRESVYRYRILENFGFEVQIYKDRKSFDLRSPDFEKDLVRFLGSRKKWNDD